MEKCWERRGCDEEMQGRCPHNQPGEPCPSECNFAACVRKTHVVTDDLDLILVHGPDLADREGEVERPGNPNRFLL